MKAKDTAKKTVRESGNKNEPVVITSKIKKRGIRRRKGGCCLK
ncbi:hypothetical protein SH601_11510 [Gracilibacillus sp. S3-1-1]|uniref:Uncharacterized protein n=1 Tax=Gracilibacillus pellucidus TaxID=3095368 RepID=A0ACC6M6M4_9BACI|nr:hypothetical protein [Gracilibacillus sp. S3-1-1]MDX8046609.1 hypothetical protein [Gracilibacillus sp. S3-1-1]